MTIWLVKAGEPLPGDPGTPRIMRTGYLAQTLAGRGHRVVWWVAAFDHQRKQFRVTDEAARRPWPGVSVEYVPSLGYTRNASLRRWFDDMVLGFHTWRRMRQATRPDVIVCSYPLIFTSLFVLAFARARRVPVLLDVRDLWPDTFGELARGWRRPLYRAFAAINRPLVRRLFSGVDGLIGITEPFLQWSQQLSGRGLRAADAVFPLTTFPVQGLEHARNQAVAELAKWGVTAATSNFCYFGAFSRMVDLFTVVDAAKLLRSRPDLRIILCGVGDDLTEVRRLGAGVETLVLPGFVDAATIRALIDVSVAGLVPYRNRQDARWSISNKVIEYLSYGLPIVSGLGGLVGTLIEQAQCGVQYEEGDAAGLAAALVALADNPDHRRTMSQNAGDVFARRFRPERVYAEFAAHVERVAGRVTHSTSGRIDTNDPEFGFHT